MSNIINPKRKTVYQSYIPKILKKKTIDEKIPLNFPIALAYKNTYSSKSEKERHMSMIEEFCKLRYLISLDPQNEFNILKEFMSKIGIQNIQYNQSHYLVKLSEFLNGEFNIDPNKTIKEIILSVLDSNFIPINLSSSLMSKIIKENLYVSPYSFYTQEKKQCNQCLRKYNSQKNYDISKIIQKNDPYQIISLNRQLQDDMSKNNNTRYDKKNRDILAKELEDELSTYRRKPIVNELLPILRKDKNKENDNIMNESLFRENNRSLLYVTQNAYSRNTSLEPTMRTNEVNKIEDGDTKRILFESMKLIKGTKRKNIVNYSEQVINRLYKPLIDRKYNEYELFKKNKKLTEVILLERIKRKKNIEQLKQSFNL